MPRKAPPNHVFPLFGSVASSARPARPLLAVLLLPLFVGCQSGPPEPDPRAMEPYAQRAPGVFAIDETPAPGGAVEPTWWSVLVAAVPTGRMDDAERMLDTVRGTGLSQAYIALRDRRPVIAFGRYNDPAEPDAQAGLRRVRQTSVGDVAPFASAVLMPPVVARAGSDTDEANLRTVRERLGRREAAYTLQIGVYARPDLSRPDPEELRLFQREAERAARTLRADGEQAFYFHGPNMSMVTVGIISEEDHDGSTQPPIESIRLRQLRRAYPHNLLNGEGMMETLRTETGPIQRLQPSRLVAIPER